MLPRLVAAVFALLFAFFVLNIGVVGIVVLVVVGIGGWMLWRYWLDRVCGGWAVVAVDGAAVVPVPGKFRLDLDDDVLPLAL